MDPDYEIADSLKLEAKERDDKEKSDNIEKIKAIINKEFNIELQLREQQLEEIQTRLAKTAKTLHLLRYVLVTAYYNRNEINYQQLEEELETTDIQSRIHPAVKKLIGERSQIGEDGSRRRSARKQGNNLVVQNSIEEIAKPIEVPIETEKEELCVDDEIKEIIPIRNRPMVKKRVIIGNISKWMPSESVEDKSTHKWMVYVRGPKDFPKIDDYVQKVVFYLHPSYKPNDVIELKDPPFHLSRRGWGEFPVRVQIHFQFSLNKPVDIIHNLKLDKTYSGRQTLGNETVADLTIYSNEVITIQSEPTDGVCSNNGVNSEETKVYNFNPLLDHTYFITGEDKLDSNEDINVDVVEEVTHTHKRKRSNSNTESVTKKRNNFHDEENNLYEIYFPSHHFKTALEALPYLLRKLPLISPQASDSQYKCIYPYTAESLAEYSSWLPVKRVSSEWSRGKMIKKYLNSSNVQGWENWSTKKIIAYARAHGFTELCTYSLLKTIKYEEYLLDNNNVPIACQGKPTFKSITPEDVGDITIAPLIDKSSLNECKFVRQTILKFGFKLENEETAIERILLKATMCFAENIIRNARGIKAHREDFCEATSVIGVEEIKTVLLHHRPEFVRLLNFSTHLLN